MYITERERRHSAESVLASAIDEESTRQSLSLGVEYRLTNYLMYVFPPSDWLGAILGASPHAGRSASIPKLHKDHLWTKLSVRIKGGFSFILFPLVCIKVHV